jgi:DHA3 family macrolide efflux protein-like MFS transporter
MSEKKIRDFVIIWFGQVISQIGSALTGFALGVWVFQHTGSITKFTMIVLCTTLPGIVLSPIVGAVVDRNDRRTVMILSNIGGCLGTLAIVMLYSSGWLHLWNICIVMAFISTCSSFLSPAYGASISLLVPKKHLGRSSGMVQFGNAAAQILSPVLAGFLVLAINIQGVLLIDSTTYIFAILTLLAVRIPRPEASPEDKAQKRSLLRDAAYGWAYILERRSLLALLIFFAATNFTASIANVLITPLVLSFADAAVYGRVVSATGIGLLSGSLLMGAWGGPKHRIYGVYVYGLVLGTALILEGLRPDAMLISIALFLAAFASPIVNGCVGPILQTKTAPNVQGRVFAAIRLVVWSSVPISYVIAGPLADKIFEPLLATDGSLAPSVGRVIGVGPGRGIGLILILMGSIALLVTAGSYFYPHLRRIEAELPDTIVEAKKEESIIEGERKEAATAV